MEGGSKTENFGTATGLQLISPFVGNSSGTVTPEGRKPLKSNIMSKVIKTIGDKEFVFYSEWKDCKSGFRHNTQLLHGAREIGCASCKYENRTWENYEYQTCMKDATRVAIANREYDVLEAYRQKMGRLRITKKEKESVWGSDEQIQVLNTLLSQL